MATTLQQFRDGVKWAAEKGRLRRKVREAIHRAYLEYIGGGENKEEAYKEITSRYADEYKTATGQELTPRILDNIIARPVGGVTDTLTEALIVQNTQSLMLDLQTARAAIQDELDEIAEAEKSGVQWYTVKRTSGGKLGDVSEDIPISEARIRLVNQQLDLYKRFEARLSLLMPKKEGLNIIIGDNSKVSMIGDSDLRAMIEAREARLGKTENKQL